MKSGRLYGFILTFIMILQITGVSAFAGSTIKITKFTKSPEKPNYSQTVLFRVRTEGDVSKVTLSIDNEKEFAFSKKSTNIWELEKKLSIEGTRYLKVTAIGADGEKDSVTDTMEVVPKVQNNKKPAEEKNTETTTERIFTGNVEKSTETTTEAVTEKIAGSDDFDGGVYNEDVIADDLYFEMAKDEDVEKLNEIAEKGVFMFVGDSQFMNKWNKEYIDPDNPEAVSYIRNGYTLVPLRAISEAFGAEVSWNQESKTALISFLGKNISVTAGEYSMTIDGKNSELSVAAEVNEGRVFVPLRAISEALNKNVYYKDRFIGITGYEHQLSENGLELIRQAVLRYSI